MKKCRKVDLWIKKKQSSIFYLGVIIGIITILVYMLNIIDSKKIKEIVAAIAFLFVAINLYISNFWSEIAMHRNHSLQKTPHLVWDKEKEYYQNIGEGIAKYAKVYYLDKDKKNLYKLYEDKDLRNNIESMSVWMGSEEMAKNIANKHQDNIIIHTDFTQRNIFVTYNYWQKENENEKEKIKSKRFIPLVLDDQLNEIVNIECINSFFINFEEKYGVKSNKERKEFVKETIFAYKERMTN